MKKIKLLCFSFLSFVFFGCASAPKPIGPSVHLLATNRTAPELLPDVEAELLKQKYVVNKISPEVGLLALQPRDFSVQHEGKKIPAQQIVQMRQEGGSLKLRIVYRCQYKFGQWEPCYADHPDVANKIRRVDQMIVKLIGNQLFRERERAESKNIGEITPPETE